MHIVSNCPCNVLFKRIYCGVFNIKYIFAKELVNQEACEMISYHTGAEIIVLHSGHNLSSLEFGNPQFSYLNILKTNEKIYFFYVDAALCSDNSLGADRAARIFHWRQYQVVYN